jgi:hypothetical protein
MATNDTAPQAEGDAPAPELALDNVQTVSAEQPADSSDDLLNMFSSVGIHQEDRSVLLNLAGDIDITDLVSELGLVAAALGIVAGQRAFAEEAEQLAA